MQLDPVGWTIIIAGTSALTWGMAKVEQCQDSMQPD